MKTNISYFILAGFIAFSFQACNIHINSDEDIKHPDVIIYNYSNHDLYIYVDGENRGRVDEGNNKTIWNLDEDTYLFEAKRIDGAIYAATTIRLHWYDYRTWNIF